MYKGPKYAAVYKQVCVEPRSSAPNMTLPVFAAERRLQAYRLSIDICCRRPTVLSSKPAGRRCFAWMGQTDGRMDGRTSDCAIEPASHNMRAARIRLKYPDQRDLWKSNGALQKARTDLSAHMYLSSLITQTLLNSFIL